MRLGQLELPAEAVFAFPDCPPEDTITILDAAPVRSEAEPLLATADILLLNETGFAGYSGAAAPVDGRHRGVAGALRRRATETVS